jgi:glyoxylase-like metal-dependent hydrolase (beta-lactamase superfamily II)
MKVETVVTGYLEENCYVLEIDNEVLVIDPGDDIDKINKVINNRHVVGILVTHKHFDHIVIKI